MKKYDVIIVGAGPAGIFCALELVKQKDGAKILLLDKGKDIDKRSCPMQVHEISCAACPECALLSGWGGAGAFSDGKLTLSPEIGGSLSRYISLESLTSLIDYVDQEYVRHGAPSETYGRNVSEINRISQLATQNGLHLIASLVRHIGTDRSRKVLANIRESLRGKIDIQFRTPVERILTAKKRACGVRLENGEKYSANYVVLAPGREGSRWLERESRRLKLTLLQNPVDIGVRVEIPAAVFEPITRITYEPKLIFHSPTFNDRVRTFCVNPRGEVVKEYLKGIWTVNGHSYANSTSDNTNFALLVSTFFTEPFDEPILYGSYIAGLANLLGKGVILQRLGDLRRGQRSTRERIAAGGVKPTLKDSTPGDLSFALPYRYLCDILEMLEALDRIATGMNSDDTLLYGAEVKFYSRLPLLAQSLETEIENLFGVGDGAGVSRGIIQASVSGVIVARELARRP